MDRFDIEEGSLGRNLQGEHCIFNVDVQSQTTIKPLVPIMQNSESCNEVKYLVGHAWSLAKEEIDERNHFEQASRILFLASRMLDLVGKKDMEIQLMSQVS